MRFLSRPKARPLCQSLRFLIPAALGVGLGVGLNAAEDALNLDLSLGEYITVNDIAIVTCTCALYLLLRKLLSRYDFMAEKTPLLNQFSAFKSNENLMSINDDSTSNDFQLSPAKKYTSEAFNIILASNLGLVAGIAANVAEKKFETDFSWGYLTVSDIVATILTLMGYCMLNKAFNSCLNWYEKRARNNVDNFFDSELIQGSLEISRKERKR